MAMPSDAGEHHGEPAAAASGNISTDAAPSSESPAPSSGTHSGAAEEPIKSEIQGAQAAPASSARPAPNLPRAAVLTWRPEERIGASGPDTIEAERPRARAGGRRFALLAAGLTLAAAIGAIAGTAGTAGVERLLASAPPTAAPAAVAVHHESGDEVRILKESVAQLKTNVKSLSENVAALRSTINLSTSAANTQFTKISESLDRVEKERAADRERADRERAAERERGEKRVTVLTPSPEPTGSVPPASAAPAEPKGVTKNPVVEGWLLRRVYGTDSALVEGRYGVVEIVPGDLVPGLGRIQEIKRQDGRWVVVTSRGLIVSAR
jgi:septal ring factor EnvC (AmiA/AmiB activator)